ncbi:MAG: hypothetical protein ACMXYG_03380 [Candidatus Woesearchaeota archaeon]
MVQQKTILHEKSTSQKSVDILKLNKELIVPSIFGEREFEVVLKSLKDERLSSTERSYLSRSIMTKLYASSILEKSDILENIKTKKKIYLIEPREIICFRGLEFSNLDSEILNKRIQNSSEIILNLEKEYEAENIFIVGSYLTKKEYNDIDVILISEIYKEIKQNNLHLIFIPKKNLEKNILFHSAIKISISNSLKIIKNQVKHNFKEVYMLYQDLIIGLLDSNISNKEARDFFLISDFISKENILNSIELDNKVREFNIAENKIQLLNDICIEVFRKSSNSKKFVAERINMNTQLLHEYKNNEHLKIFNSMLKRIKWK